MPRRARTGELVARARSEYESDALWRNALREVTSGRSVVAAVLAYLRDLDLRS